MLMATHWWWFHKECRKCHFDGLVQDSSNSIANALELLQSCTKPSIYIYNEHKVWWLVISVRGIMMRSRFSNQCYRWITLTKSRKCGSTIFPNMLNKQSSFRWPEIPWRFCDITVMILHTESNWQRHSVDHQILNSRESAFYNYLPRVGYGIRKNNYDI